MTGLVEALSTSAKSSVYNAIDFVKELGSPKKGEILLAEGL
jgi:hypothetical protein